MSYDTRYYLIISFLVRGAKNVSSSFTYPCACAYINSSLVYRPAEIIDKFLRFMEEASDDREGDNENFLSFLNRLKNLWSVGSWDLKNPN